ncbi:MAG: urease accessory protein UreF [Gaiellaceae bacterium]
MDAGAFLTALQLADSALPTGRFAHSAGLEALLDGGVPSELELVEFVSSYVTEGVAPLDGVVAAHATRASSLERLIALDDLVRARKIVPGARTVSLRCGRQLARLAAEITDDRLALELAGAVRGAEAEGHLCVVEGTLARAAGLNEEEAVLISLRGAASGALSAAVRLGAISARQAQRILAELRDPLARACACALTTPLDRVHSTVPEFDLLALAHPRGEARSFTT